MTFAADAAGVPLIGAIVLGAINGGVVAVAADRIVFRNFADRNPVVLLVVSIGVAFILRNAIRIIWTADTRYYEVPIEAAPQFFGIAILPVQVAIVALSIVVLELVFLLLNRTRIGIAMRAASDDTDLARLRGIDTKRLVIYVSLLGGIIAGTTGIMLGLDANLRSGQSSADTSSGSGPK